MLASLCGGAGQDFGEAGEGGQVWGTGQEMEFLTFSFLKFFKFFLPAF